MTDKTREVYMWCIPLVLAGVMAGATTEDGHIGHE